MDALRSLPDRDCFGVIEEPRAVQDAPAYVCCHDTALPADRVIRNGGQQLHDLYKNTQKRNTAAAAKRQARQQLDDRGGKRPQSLANGIGKAGSAAATGTEDAGLGGALAAIAGSRKATTPLAGLPAGALQQRHPATAAGAGRPAANITSAGATAAGKRRDAVTVPCSITKPQAASAAAAAAAVAPKRLQPGGSSRQTVYSAEVLKAKTNKELVELLRARSCPVSGSKPELIRRLLDYQQRLKKAQG